MEKLNFYDVNADYINYLKKAEIEHRGFTEVPNIEYGDKKKFLCGIILRIDRFEYYVPVTSYKQEKSENFLIIFEDDKYNKVKGSLRFNFMIPVPKNCIHQRIIKNENDIKRKIFLHKQLEFINKNIDTIKNRANRTYLRVINNYNPHLIENSCDFKFLEQKCREYIWISDEYIATTNQYSKSGVGVEEVDKTVLEIWSQALNLMKEELTEVSFNTWLKDLKPLFKENNYFYVSAPNAFHQGIIEGRYIKLIENALRAVTDVDYTVEVSIP